MRLFLAGLGTETNTFASFPTGIEDFRTGMWAEGGIENLPADANDGADTALDQERARPRLGGRAGPARLAAPAGPTTRAAYESMRDRILSDLAAAGAGRRGAALPARRDGRRRL